VSGYPFVQAYHDYGPAKGPRRAFVIHMAEGGGTVGYLSRPNPNRVSVHYVIERSGRIVQMLLESHAGGHVNPAKLRTSNGPAPYGVTVRQAVMGGWDRDPNSATLAVEVEGYALAGPNADQHAALRRLVEDVRGRYPTIGLLGHRDFQDYKRCPGGHIPWPALGGHGPAQESDDVIGLRTRPAANMTAGVARIAAGVEVIRVEDRHRTALTVEAIRSAAGPFLCEDLDDAIGYLVNIGSATCWVRESEAGYTPGEVADARAMYNAGVEAAAVAARSALRP
jgi:hypothetical protein